MEGVSHNSKDTRDALLGHSSWTGEGLLGRAVGEGGEVVTDENHPDVASTI